MKKMYVLLLSVLLAGGVLSGCGTVQQDGSQANASQQEEKEEISVVVKITKQNGEEKLVDQEISVEEGSTLMELMKENFDVEESEGFINEIEGISMNQEKKMAWMYTINGEEAMVGANEYQLEQGDVIVFDYHSWE
ncbi:DUF4430 domain-containing protein [Halobacillus yeomjeoni]|uniref:DUF4430 domain-containing protein n=1 Tax=Halobacillus yeomjeoni TaxID=311194 RepID=A0A931HUZ3_9BACI|nr:DUF4430 domain-containing protein [Halobacillus yeomjeoni]MBH0229631.1 DUF4430 domain-containing protein [Halobacillus yeomjeoni]